MPPRPQRRLRFAHTVCHGGYVLHTVRLPDSERALSFSAYVCTAYKVQSDGTKLPVALDEVPLDTLAHAKATSLFVHNARFGQAHGK